MTSCNGFLLTNCSLYWNFYFLCLNGLSDQPTHGFNPNNFILTCGCTCIYKFFFPWLDSKHIGFWHDFSRQHMADFIIGGIFVQLNVRSHSRTRQDMVWVINTLQLGAIMLLLVKCFDNKMVKLPGVSTFGSTSCS